MLTILKKLFSKSTPPAAPAVVAPVVASAPMPTIEVAHLSLTAITARFSDDLKAFLASEPDASATVALPLPTILKQLPTGAVKMSLASLQRQAHGLLKAIPTGDKRMVNVPLGEVLRHLRPNAFRRRPDQRPVEVPENGYNLFGDSTNPYALAPDDAPQPQVVDLSKIHAAHHAVNGTAEEPRVLKMDDGLRAFCGNGAASSHAPASTSAVAPKLQMPAPAEAVAPSLGGPLASAPAAPIAKPEGPTLILPVALLAAAWPEDVRAELQGLDPATTVALPLDDVAAGLSKGRVAFSWGQIRAWLEPAPAAPTATADSVALQLPLKVVAPAFLAASKKPKAERKTAAVDESIPSLFSDSRAPAPAPVAAPEAPVTLAAPIAPMEPEPVVEAAPPGPQVPQIAETIGELFGQPSKQDWNPAEIVAGTVKLPGVAGAIIALQEGLQVATSLPEGVKGEVVAAFLPQIFARLNQYSSEMKLGNVDDLLFTTHGAHCQIYRLGHVFLAVLGKPGESLPWQELRIICDELARQTQQ